MIFLAKSISLENNFNNACSILGDKLIFELLFSFSVLLINPFLV